MSKTLKVKIKPGKTLAFPAECVHCSQPAAGRMQIRKRKGRLTRLIDVPVCETCAGELKRRSFQEERLARIGPVATVAVSVAVLLLLIALLPSGLFTWLRVLIALFLSLAFGATVLALFKQKSLQAARPEKLAILDSARLTDFSWRTTTFEFENEAFAEDFTEINWSLLMEEGVGSKE